MGVINFIRDYERLAVFQLGRFMGMKGPGMVIVIPVLQSSRKIDLRERVRDVPPQRNITRDNAGVDVDFVYYMRVDDPQKSVMEVQDFELSARQMAMTNLRAVIGDLTLDEVLSKRDQINAVLQQKLDEVTVRWGVKVTAVEIREIEPPPAISDAMTRQMSAERTRRAAITESEGQRDAQINVADGERQAAILRAQGDKQSSILRAEGRREAQLLDAEGFASALQRIFETAQGVDANTMGLQYLDTLRTIGESPSTKWIIPTELLAVATTISARIGQTAGSDGGS